MLRICGRVYHLIGSLLPPPGDAPAYAQVYVSDLSEDSRAQQRNRNVFNNCDSAILRRLEQMLLRVNPYIKQLSTVKERLQQEPHAGTVY